MKKTGYEAGPVSFDVDIKETSGFFLFFFHHLQVAKEIWICEKQTVTPWKGDILSYKEELKKKVSKKHLS